MRYPTRCIFSLHNSLWVTKTPWSLLGLWNGKCDTCAESYGIVVFERPKTRQNPDIDAFHTPPHVMRVMISASSTTLTIATLCFRKVWLHSQKSSDDVANAAPPSPPARRGPQCAAHSQPSRALPLSFKLPPAVIWPWRDSVKWACERSAALYLPGSPCCVCCCRK